MSSSEERDNALALASLRWLLVNDSALGHVIRELSNLEDEDLHDDPLRILLMHITSELSPVEVSKSAFSGRSAFWSYTDPDDTQMPVEDLHTYELQLREELAWVLEEKKRRIELLKSPEEVDGQVRVP